MTAFAATRALCASILGQAAGCRLVMIRSHYTDVSV